MCFSRYSLNLSFLFYHLCKQNNFYSIRMIYFVIFSVTLNLCSIHHSTICWVTYLHSRSYRSIKAGISFSKKA